MKYILSLILFFIVAFCKGQVVVTDTFCSGGDGIGSGNSIDMEFYDTAGGRYFNLDSAIFEIQDYELDSLLYYISMSLPDSVIEIYGDTTKAIRSLFAAYLKDHPIDIPPDSYDTLPTYLLVTNKQILNLVYWIEGYTIYEGDENAYTEIEYLDEKKKPLPDYLIVWVSKIKH